MSDLDDIDLQPEDFESSVPLKKVPYGDVFEASRAGDVDRLRYLLESGVNVNARDRWDSVALYYACLAGCSANAYGYAAEQNSDAPYSLVPGFKLKIWLQRSRGDKLDLKYTLRNGSILRERKEEN
nr:BTB/POZ domain-containing protein At2g04740 [Ipomoea batatas]